MERQRQESRKLDPFVYTLIYGLIVIAGAQLRIHMFTKNFVVSAGVILFALFMLVLDEFSTLPVVFISAVGVMITRAFAVAGGLVNPDAIWETGMPEFVFYIAYGVIIYIFFHYGKAQTSYGKTFIALAIPDFAANVLEMYIRSGESAMPVRVIGVLFLVALIRSGIIFAIYWMILKYGLPVVRIPRSEEENPAVKEAFALAKASDEAQQLAVDLKQAGASAEILEQADRLAEEIRKAMEVKEQEA
ncbi:MAG: hypothetical protein Q4C18_07315 [Eubacteriales bacterium]|nr:hypothetical protein [Eubacteriales bacterium]